jgi:hypothetical protein
MRDLGKFLGFASQRPEKEIRQAAGQSLGVDGLSPTSPAHAGQFLVHAGQFIAAADELLDGVARGHSFRISIAEE